MPSLVNFTPIGRMTIMAAWILLIVVGILARKKI